MRLGKYWKENVTGFMIEPDEWRPKNNRIWKRFVKASVRLKLKGGESIKVFLLAPYPKEDFRKLLKIRNK